MGDLLDFVVPASDRFELFSIEPDFIQAFEEGGVKKFRGVASSTTKDLHGDTILLEALQEMETQAIGLNMFLNHSYNVPDDVGGSITKAIVRQKGVDHDGNPNYQLEIEGEVEEDNPQALKTWGYVRKGRKIGLSIGAMIPKGGATRQKDGTLIINSLQLLEVSFVGIPANPKSWVEYAASAIRDIIAKAETHTLGSPTITLSEGRYKIEGSLEGLDLNLGSGPISTEHVFGIDPLDEAKTQISYMENYADGNSKLSVLGAWDLTDDDDRLLAVAEAGEDAVNKATVWVTTRDGDQITIGEPDATASVTNGADPDIIEASMCPTCGKGRDATGCSDSYHASAEPDVSDAKVRIIEVDTGDDSSSDDGSQGASASEPDDALAAPEADIAAEAEPVILDGLTEDQLLRLSFDQLRAAATVAVTQMVAAKEAQATEKAARIAAETERDAVVQAAGELVARTAKLIEKVANAPLSRKAVLRDVQTEFSTSVESYYGTEFARALAGKK